jgi:carboxypeptidase Q
MKYSIRLLLTCVLLSLSAAAQNSWDKLSAEALKPSPIDNNLQVLTDQIGGRVPGTPAMEAAVRWGLDSFRAARGENVHSEPFQIAQSWSEGATSFQVTAPEHFRVRAVSFGWAPAVNTPIHARIVYLGEGTPDDFANAGDLKNAILVVKTDVLKTWEDLFDEYMKAPPVISAAAKAHAAGLAFWSSREHDILYRHIHTANGKIDVLPLLVIAREDGERIARLQESGQKLTGELVMPNHIGGPLTTANVVAEIKGTERPDEFVVLGAHLDSWELGTGALDNGCNAALVIDALRAIKSSGLKPKRTIRFVLFSGEEQGMLGSWAYVKQHRDELHRAVAVVIFDAGSGRTTGFSVGGRTDAIEPLQKLLSPLQEWQANELTTDALWGTDHADFLLEGVPTLVANQEEANYLVNYHATSDTFDKVDMPQLKKHVAIAAYTAFAVADAPDRIAPRQSRAEIEELLYRTKLDEQMKGFEAWSDWQSGKRGRAKQ